ncbi:hypothetical protein BYZ73_00310 [Rhodovulum viride]|uniref:Nickel/cobalt transporter regulator n=2 Tax=Rhodovulum viride TaxID=1231134 RepID=A0ABX9DP89_9RHOB|nr:hypothetical protein BYZ73_00310 [Rhodovulum viride]
MEDKMRFLTTGLAATIALTAGLSLAQAQPQGCPPGQAMKNGQCAQTQPRGEQPPGKGQPQAGAQQQPGPGGQPPGKGKPNAKPQQGQPGPQGKMQAGGSPAMGQPGPRPAQGAGGTGQAPRGGEIRPAPMPQGVAVGHHVPKDFRPMQNPERHGLDPNARYYTRNDGIVLKVNPDTLAVLGVVGMIAAMSN